MLVVVASRHDASARDLVARWGSRRATILTCEDLSTAGWRYYLHDPLVSTAVVDGQILPCRQIVGVLTRRPAVLPDELLHIEPPDRSYVAAEMTAFLLSWLASLPRPVLNRPTPTCLSGPNWRPEQWVQTAALLGIRVRPLECHVPPLPRARGDALPDDGTDVIVVGERWYGRVSASLGTQALRLARAAGVHLLGVRFSGRTARARFVGATLWPPLADEAVADAVRAFLEGASPARL